jgi:nucleotide-binding universal stress UspA family protein
VQHKRFREGTVIGSTSERIIRFATFPVLTVGRSAG